MTHFGKESFANARKPKNTDGLRCEQVHEAGREEHQEHWQADPCQVLDGRVIRIQIPVQVDPCCPKTKKPKNNIYTLDIILKKRLETRTS